jgi:hypothetical protein
VDASLRLEVRRCDIGDETRLEAAAQALFKSRNIASIYSLIGITT